MRSISHHRQLGYILVENLVSLIVVAIGVLGIAKMNMVLLSSTGIAKTRAEALQLAQAKFDEFRNVTTAAEYAALADGSDTITGTNETFRRSWEIDGTSNPTDARVCVAWPNTVTDACAATSNRIVLSGLISWNNPGELAHVSSTSALGGFIRTPTGRATVGGNAYDTIPDSAVSNNITLDNGSTANDGTKTYLSDDGKTLELIGANGEVLLTVKGLSCETEAPGFSTISGKLYVAAKNGNPIAPFSDIRILSSDASYCAMLTADSSWKVPANCTGNTCKYFYTYYQCYLGAEWWGNIGVQRIDSPNTNDKVCVGNPVDSGPATLFNRSATLNTSHAYRGFAETESGVYETRGIGEQTDVNVGCTAEANRTVYKYVPTHYGNHNFVHDNLTGSETCQTTETTLNSLVTPKPLGTTAGTNPTVTRYDSSGTVTLSTDPDVVANVYSVAANNPGKYYCMSNDDGGYSGVNCPNLSSTGTTAATLIHGTITRYGGAELSGIDTTVHACKTGTTTWTANGTTSYSYSCSLDWTGFAGGSWYGDVVFTATGTASLCASGATTTVTPTGNTVTYAINDRLATPANALAFADVPLAVTDVQIDMSVYADTCGLGQPSLSWNGTDPKSLSWPAITNATAYKVYECTSTSNNTTTMEPCSPTTLATTPTQPQSTLTYTPAPVNNRTKCVMVKATNLSIDSAASAIKCIYRSGNTYAYQ
ncbi:hypothetical protein EZJ19_09290 [Parasulfuritortus cantonensis]|uniref:Uncharacterized protein n=1 Tax=Parasulfuritortus cantonensis TaxID=2528202 RepID=A0A4R1BCI7_9PROT|nr:hypothetical protein [Parasulfuritortus cantonensis]TCJ14765.1 hypothetical protein EZJ19_09290 [Parasulfuritortus cantonensis]